VPYPNFDPVLFQLGPLAIRWYALAYVAGILLGWRYAVHLVRNQSLWNGTQPTLSPLQIDDMVLWVTLGIIVGGRLGSVLFYNTSLIWQHPLEIFMIWRGGMSFHGGLLGVTLALLLFARRQKLALLGLTDIVAAAQPIGQFFGRIANFINGELWGRPTDGPLGVVFCNERIAQAYGGLCPPELLVARHPSQLYEAALEGLLLFVILMVCTHRLKWLPRRGAITGLFLVLYGVFRTSLEFVREPDAQFADVQFPLGMTMGIMLSIPMILAGAYLLWRAFKAQPAPAATTA
jgi:phosphatidylglycerol---prolipoprotein diacylglyceryl transferase